MLLSDKSIEFILLEKRQKAQRTDNQRVATLPNFRVFSSKRQLIEKSAKMRVDFCVFSVVTDCKQEMQNQQGWKPEIS